MPIGDMLAPASSARELATALRVLFDGADRGVILRIVAANLMGLAGGVVAGLAPLALKAVIDSAASTGAVQPLAAAAAQFGAAYLLCLGLVRLLAELRPTLTSAAEQRLFAGLRSRYFRHLLTLPLSFHLDCHGGALVQGLQQAIMGYQIILASLVNGMVPIIVEAATVATVLLTLGEPALILSFAVTTLALALGIGMHTAALRRTAQAVSQTSVDGYAMLAEGLTHYESIKCFGAEQASLDRFERWGEQLQSRWAQLQRRRLSMGLMVSILMVLSMAATLAISVHAVSSGSLTLGGFVLANLYMVQVIRPLEMLSTAARDVFQGLAFLRPLTEVWLAPAEAARLPRPSLHPTSSRNGATGGRKQEGSAHQALCVQQTQHRTAASISFRDVCFSRGAEAPLLEGFRLDITPGHTIAVVGESGSGKSTLVRLLLRFFEPQAGCILINGVAIDTLPRPILRSMVAVVPQDVALFDRSIAANIGLGRETISPGEITRAAEQAGLTTLIKSLPRGIETEIGERGVRLSGGERQRIAIARAIVRNPEIYVFDEATSMLDLATEQILLSNLKEICAGRTTLMITHRLSVIPFVDEVAVLDGGRIVEQGSHPTLLGHGGRYAALWHAHQAAI